MTLQDFISVWQSQPFRAFRIHTAGNALTVTYPLAAALTADMKVIGITADGRCEKFSLDEITRFEVFGEPVSIADAINGVAPEILARNGQLLAAGMESGQPTTEESTPVRKFDRGQVEMRGFTTEKGLHVVEASVTGSEKGPAFTTAGTRWNLHGWDQFENGTSLYLHHLDHPTVEQRLILWPPDSGTFESFAEAMPFAKLMKELVKRDERLAHKPAKIKEPPAGYFRKILPIFPKIDPDARIDAYGDELDDDDFDRFEIHLVPRTLANGVVVNNPCLVDVPAENFMFNLTETAWDATFARGEKTITVVLHHPDRARAENLEVIIDPYLMRADIAGVGTELPLGFVERELRNFALYERWDLLIGALRNGPDRLKLPDVVVPLPKDFVMEMWAGETRFPLPFLQPRILAPDGSALLDFRTTSWAASLVAAEKMAAISLRLWSHERENRCADPRFDLNLNLVTQRVTCAGVEGSTTLGMIQALVGQIRGIKWLGEQLPALMAKGRMVPLP